MSGTTQIWNRLEPQPRTESFKRALRAEVRDALWMISSQWRVGEFNGDDAGTPAFAFLDMQTSRIDRIAKKSSPYTAVDETRPLECSIERQTIVPDLMHRLDTGRQFLKIFQSKIPGTFSTSDVDTALDNVRNSGYLQFAAPSPSTPVNEPEFYSSPELWQATVAVSAGRAVDGYKIAKLTSITSQVSLTNTALVPYLTAAHTDFLAWYTKTFSQPATPPNDNYWFQNHLEYSFACSAPRTSTGYTVLGAREYYQGNLDWYSFNIQPPDAGNAALRNGTPQLALLKDDPFTLIPSKITYAGMPAPRYWEMEDRRVEFGNLSVSKTNTATMLVTEFALKYSNDWTIIPYTVPVGTIMNLRKVLVTDVFGQVTYIVSGNEANWNMFTLTTEGSAVLDDRLFIPPVVQNKEEGDAMESVTFLRDEMANMVWAVETTISDGVSRPQPAKEAGQRLIEFLEANTQKNTPVPPNPNSAKLKFNLMTPRIPEHWIPYTPVNRGSPANEPNIQLQRAAMPRQIHQNPPSGRVRPRTELLKDGANPPTTPYTRSFVWEEEVPRSGAVITMSWQRARWQNGKIALWIGREKTNGRGEANSGLRFDYLTEK